MKRLVQKLENGMYRLDGNKAFTQDGLKKLYEYEDAEEQGLLKKLPCPEGTECYRVVKRNYGGNFIRDIEFKLTDLCDFGKTVFLTREAAKGALKGGEGE